MYQLYDTNYGNAKLLPEEGKNYEVGINHKIDDSSMINAHYFKRDSDRNIGFDVKEILMLMTVKKLMVLIFNMKNILMTLGMDY